MFNIKKIADKILSNLDPLIERHDYGERGLDQVERAALELKKKKMLPKRLEKQIENRNKKLRPLINASIQDVMDGRRFRTKMENAIDDIKSFSWTGFEAITREHSDGVDIFFNSQEDANKAVELLKKDFIDSQIEKPVLKGDRWTVRLYRLFNLKT